MAGASQTKAAQFTASQAKLSQLIRLMTVQLALTDRVVCAGLPKAAKLLEEIKTIGAELCTAPVDPRISGIYRIRQRGKHGNTGISTQKKEGITR